MPLHIGVIADDLTGATDIASFLVEAGLRTVQLNSTSEVPSDLAAEAVVIGLKTRSIPADQAVAANTTALRLLQQLGAQQVIFKYCSTFDSTSEGNIGPVTDALLDALDEDFTAVVPALPVNGRTVYQGNLFVHGQPLAESGMRHHPITPMHDSNLLRLMDAQSRGSSGLVPYDVVENGPEAVRAELERLRLNGARYAVIDTLTHAHLDTIGLAVHDMPLVTGGSGVGSGVGHALVQQNPAVGEAAAASWRFTAGKTVVLSGSASEMTNAQVQQYLQHAPHLPVDIDQLVRDASAYVDQSAEWVLAHSGAYAPMVYATAPAAEVQHLQNTHGAQFLSSTIENFFAELASTLRQRGVTRFITAGGETSGAVTQSLKVGGFEVGPQISPGVPWVRSLDGELDLALKSGNFGDEDFFRAAQHMTAGPKEA